MNCPPGSDRSFGPRVNPNCRSFDFTLQFEDIIFTCLPAALFLVLSPSRIHPLLYKHNVVAWSLRSKLLASKLIAWTGLFNAQLAFLILRIENDTFETGASVASDVLSLIATGTALVLSYMDHKRAPRPSTLLSLYLSTSVILCVARIRTIWLLESGSRMSAVMTVIFVLTLVVLVLESIEKKSIVVIDERIPALEMTSGFWTRTSFTWLAGTFKMGYSKVLSVEDLPALDTKLESSVLRHKLASTWDKYDHRDRHSLLRACLRSYFLSFMSPVMPRLCLSLFTFSQPFIINTTVSFIGQKDPNANYGNGLIGACALAYLGIAASNSIYQYQNFRFTTRLRGGLIALVYQQTLRTRAVDMGEITAITLMGTDIERINNGMDRFHEVWGSLLDIAIASWLLGRQLSFACIAPIVLVLVFIGAIAKVSMASKTAQHRWIEKVQERIRATEILLGNIKAVKMLGLTEVMSNIVQNLRIKEIDTSKVFRKLLVVTLMLSLTPINLAPLFTFGVYAIISIFKKNDRLLAAQAFTSIALIALLTFPVVVFIQVLPQVVQCISSFDRIQEFCNYRSDPTSNDDDVNTDTPARSDTELESEMAEIGLNLEKPLISLNGESFGWNRDHPALLKDLKVDIPRNAVIAVVGLVGSGKSSFLSAILGEMICVPPVSEAVLNEGLVRNGVAYCSQEPWLENRTILQNIIGVSPFDRKWYDTVKHACGLDGDVKQLQGGDDASVGSKGLNLSGGQKQRIALARAVYARRRVVILDDVFSGMDAHTADTVSSRLLGRDGMLRNPQTTIILVTHSNKIMSLADTIISLEGGRIKENGSSATLLQRKDYLNKLALSYPPPDEVIEETTNATVAESASQEPQKPVGTARDTSSLLTDMKRKSGDLSVYKYYIVNAGYVTVALYTIFVVICIFCTEFPAVWIKLWSEANSEQPNKNLGIFVGVYAIFGVFGTLSVTLAAWVAYVSIISNTSMRLHSDLLKATLKAPFQFFTTTDSGELLNRFSEDMELIDMRLPQIMVNYTSTAVSIFTKLIILAVFSQYLGAVLPILFIVLYFLQRFYLQTSRQLRLLAIEARSPLYSFFSSTVLGAPTIRAFAWKTTYQTRAHMHIDTSQRPIYLQHCIQTWLTFVLNVVAAALAVLLVAVVITWREKFSAGSVGVSLVMVVGFSETLARGIQSWTMMESSVGAVTRVKRFISETPSEESEVSNANEQIPAEWPQNGTLEFKDVVASYGSNFTPVLNQISLKIQPGQHLAIIGRTGSGKTSLLLTLLRLLPLQSGDITLSTLPLPLSSLPPSFLRAHINAIPQDAFLIPGAIRFNIDPFETASDHDIIRALDRVGLWGIVQSQGNLDARIDEKAWSAGQRQLLCLARAMVRKSEILVVDEAMSSVDSETESLMQKIIDEEFKDCTVLAVMHRLKHIRSYDRVVVMERGNIVEEGVVEELLEKEGTKLGALVKAGEGEVH